MFNIEQYLKGIQSPTIDIPTNTNLTGSHWKSHTRTLGLYANWLSLGKNGCYCVPALDPGTDMLRLFIVTESSETVAVIREVCIRELLVDGKVTGDLYVRASRTISIDPQGIENILYTEFNYQKLTASGVVPRLLSAAAGNFRRLSKPIAGLVDGSERLLKLARG